jgi:hypothetical protein
VDSDAGPALTVLAPEELSGLAGQVQRVIERPAVWLGLGRVELAPLTVVLVPDVAGFARWSRGRVPSWGAGLTIPARRVVVIRANAGRPLQTLRHELAHMALHTRVRGRVPLWFSEGYAALASGEHGRLDALQLNLAVALGRIPPLDQLDVALRGSATDAGPAYALAAAAVADIARRHPSGSLDPFLARLAAGTDFDSALVASTGLTRPDFAAAWRQDLRRRYNLLVWLAAGGAWVIVLGVLATLSAARRRRDAPRRAALDEGWPVPSPDEVTGSEEVDDDSMTTGLPAPRCLDPSASRR